MAQFIDQPQLDSIGEQAWKDITDYDPALVLQWQALEDPESGDYAHWVVYRRQDEKSIRVGQELRESGLITMSREERDEFTHVLDVTNPDGTYRPIDNRLLLELVKRDPLQHGRTVLEGKRVQDAEIQKRRAAAKRAQNAEIAEDNGVVSDMVMSHASSGLRSGERNMQGRGYGGKPAPYFDEREVSNNG